MKLAAFLLAALVLPLFAFAQIPKPEDAETVRGVLEAYLRATYQWDPEGTDADREKQDPTRFHYALTDLDADGLQDIVVFIEAGGWCGMGGCDVVALHRDACGYSVIPVMAPANLPIGLATSRSNGWLDLVVHLRGGGGPTYDGRFHYSGKAYDGDRDEKNTEKSDRDLIAEHPPRSGMILHRRGKSPKATALFHAADCAVS